MSPVLMVLALVAQSASPELRVLISEGGRTVEYDSHGSFLRLLLSHNELWVKFSASRRGDRLAYVASTCEPGVGRIMLKDFASGVRREVTRESPLYYKKLMPGFVERYTDPAISPDGDRIAFAIRPCQPRKSSDAVESAGPIAIWSAASGQSRIVEATERIDENGPAFANDLVWSPDGRRLLASFETGFAVFSVDEGTLDYLHREERVATATWTHGLGWVGSNCVAYIRGDPDRALTDSMPRVVNLRTRENRPLPSVLGLPPDALNGLYQISHPYYFVWKERTLRLVGPNESRVIHRTKDGAVVQVLPATLTGPPWCEPGK